MLFARKDVFVVPPGSALSSVGAVGWHGGRRRALLLAVHVIPGKREGGRLLAKLWWGGKHKLRFGERAGEKLATQGCLLDPVKEVAATPSHLQLLPHMER